MKKNNAIVLLNNSLPLTKNAANKTTVKEPNAPTCPAHLPVISRQSKPIHPCMLDRKQKETSNRKSTAAAASLGCMHVSPPSSHSPFPVTK
jgi:hypothetical protein